MAGISGVISVLAWSASSKQDSMAEGHGRGELLTAWWTGSRKRKREELRGVIALPSHTTVNTSSDQNLLPDKEPVISKPA